MFLISVDWLGENVFCVVLSEGIYKYMSILFLSVWYDSRG